MELRTCWLRGPRQHTGRVCGGATAGASSPVGAYGARPRVLGVLGAARTKAPTLWPRPALHGERGRSRCWAQQPVLTPQRAPSGPAMSSQFAGTPDYERFMGDLLRAKGDP